jgi:hypothetical protein
MNRSLAFLSAVLSSMFVASASAFHQVTPTLVEITPTSGAGIVENQRWAGIRYVIFDSDADVVHAGSTGRQIFLFDLLDRDLNGSPGITQLTSGPGDHRHGSTGKLANLIVYDTQLVPGGPRQLVLLDRKKALRYPLTNGLADSSNPRMDESSRMVVFESTADFFATGPAGSQIYRIDLRKFLPGCPFPCVTTGNEGLAQITSRAGTSRNAVPSSGGKIIAFESDADFLGLGEATSQVYTYDVKRALFTILGRGPGTSGRPSISLNGGWVAFESDTDLMGNGSTGTNVYARKRNHSFPEQVSFGAGGHSSGASLSANGHAVTLVSSADLAGTGSDGPEVFSYDLRRNELRQITNGPNTVNTAAYSGGVFVSFLSNGDLLGTGTNEFGLYLVNLFTLDDTVP